MIHFVFSQALKDPRVREWLDGVEPAWTLLTFDSLRMLRQPPSASDGPIRFAADLTADDIEKSAAARNALILTTRAIESGGLPVTATGNLTRAVVADMCKLIDWPDYDQAGALSFNKVINEPDFMPLHIVRLLCEAANLVKIQRGKLVATPTGRHFLSPQEQGGLVALLAQIAFWRIDLSYFARGLLGSWPQADIGIALWSLSVCADDWQTEEKLTRLCTIPEPAMILGSWDRTPYAFEGRILRPLLWFGLLEHRREPIPLQVRRASFLSQDDVVRSAADVQRRDSAATGLPTLKIHLAAAEPRDDLRSDRIAV